jgi:hypothetical protein
MFKAKLIDDVLYYKLRRRNSLISLASAISYGIIIFIFDLPLSYSILILCFFIAVIYIQIRTTRAMLTKLGNHFIELDLNTINILDKKKNILQSFTPAVLDSIHVKSSLELYGENITYLADELKGKTHSNSIEIVDTGQTHTYLFQVDSFYMLEQLKKIIEHWQMQNTHIKLSKLEDG